MTKKDVIYVVFSRLWSSFMQLWIVKGNLQVNVLDYRFSLHDKCAQMEDQKQERKQTKSLLNNKAGFQFWKISQNPAEKLGIGISSTYSSRIYVTVSGEDNKDFLECFTNVLLEFSGDLRVV